MKLSLVIPAYNEAAVIRDTVESVLSALSGKFGWFELIVVNDGSTDGTGKILSNLARENVIIISGEKNRGKGHAVRTGMLKARGDCIFFTDADLAYGLNVIEYGARRLVETGADIVAGSRKLEKGGYGGYPALRLLTSKCFSLVSMAASGMRYDTQCGIKGFTKRAAHSIFKDCVTNGFSFDFEVMMLAEKRGYRIVEMPVKIINHRESGVNVARDSVLMLKEIAAVRRYMKKMEGSAVK